MITAGLLNRRAAHRRPMAAPDGQGGQTVTLAELGMVALRIAQPTDTERVAGSQHGADITHSAYLAPDVDVRRGDELELVDDGLVLDVHATLRPSAPAYVRADCESRQREG